jgi:hypothetical protein
VNKKLQKFQDSFTMKLNVHWKKLGVISTKIVKCIFHKFKDLSNPLSKMTANFKWVNEEFWIELKKREVSSCQTSQKINSLTFLSTKPHISDFHSLSNWQEIWNSFRFVKLSFLKSELVSLFSQLTKFKIEIDNLFFQNIFVVFSFCSYRYWVLIVCVWFSFLILDSFKIEFLFQFQHNNDERQWTTRERNKDLLWRVLLFKIEKQRTFNSIL